MPIGAISFEKPDIGIIRFSRRACSILNGIADACFSGCTMESRFSEQICIGYEVRSSDGEKLGNVVAIHRDSFVVEKGLFFTKDFMVSFDDVLELREDEVHLSRTQKELGARPNLWDELAGMASSEDHSYVGRVAGQFDPEPEERPYASERSAEEDASNTPMRKTG